MDRQDTVKASRRIFKSGCGDDLGSNQLRAALRFVAEELTVVPRLVNEVCFEPEAPAAGWLSSGRAVLLCENGSIAVRVDTRAGDFADRAEIRCEMKFIPLNADSWNIVRTSEGVAVGSPHDVCSKSVGWRFQFQETGIVEPMSDGPFESNPRMGPDGTAVEFATKLGWT